MKVGLERFVEERSEDLTKLLSSLDKLGGSRSKLSGGQGIRLRFQRSWKPYKTCFRWGTARGRGRLRRRKLRTRPGPVTAQASPFVHAAAKSVGLLADGEDLRVRAHWRKSPTMSAAHAWKAVKSGTPCWLPTHLWHAKQAAMEDAWGYRLAAHGNFYGTRSLCRAASKHCCMHDRSYMELFELAGSAAAVADALQLCGVGKSLTLTEAALKGSRRLGATLWTPVESSAEEPQRPVAPVLLLWSAGEHPCRAAAGTDQPSQAPPSPAAEALAFCVDVGMPQAECKPFEGAAAGAGRPQAEQIASDSDPQEELLQQPRGAELRCRRLWLWVHPAAAEEAAACLSRASAVTDVHLERMEPTGFLEFSGPSSVEVLARAVPPSACAEGAGAASWLAAGAAAADARVSLPPGAALALEVDIAALEIRGPPMLQQGDSTQPPRLPSASAEGCKLWEQARTTHEALAAPRGVPGASTTVPIVVVARTAGAVECSGVDVLLPRGALVQHVWLRCIHAGARMLGFKDRQALRTSAGLRVFPTDFPETNAGNAAAQATGLASQQKHLRRPPGKRVNFAASATPCPFVPDWGLAGCTAAAPGSCRGGNATAASGATGLVPLELRCTGRRVPQRLCHLHSPGPEDLAALASSLANAGLRAADFCRAEPPAWHKVAWEGWELAEPLRKPLKLKRCRRREALSTPAAEHREALRPLLGFITSGGLSRQTGHGAAVGSCASAALLVVLRRQQAALGAGRGPQWLLLWARNPSSLQYFPVWGRLSQGEGAGPA